MADNILDEYEDISVGRIGIPIVKRKDSWARSILKRRRAASAVRRQREMHASARRNEPSLPKFKCLED